VRVRVRVRVSILYTTNIQQCILYTYKRV